MFIFGGSGSWHGDDVMAGRTSRVVKAVGGAIGRGARRIGTNATARMSPVARERLSRAMARAKMGSKLAAKVGGAVLVGAMAGRGAAKSINSLIDPQTTIQLEMDGRFLKGQASERKLSKPNIEDRKYVLEQIGLANVYTHLGRSDQRKMELIINKLATRIASDPAVWDYFFWANSMGKSRLGVEWRKGRVVENVFSWLGRYSLTPEEKKAIEFLALKLPESDVQFVRGRLADLHDGRIKRKDNWMKAGALLGLALVSIRLARKRRD
jgi:hypothetical protein